MATYKFRTFIVSILCFFTCLNIFADGQKMLLSAHISDGKTKEALPYAQIFVRPGLGTMTNEEGDFEINVSPDDTVQISYMGYETLRIVANNMPKRITLHPLSRTLDEVTVMPITTILAHTYKKLQKEHNKYSKYTSRYFYRQRSTTEHVDLVEAFVEANSVANIENTKFLSGRHGRETGNALQRPLISSMNFHHPFELGLMAENSVFWKSLHTHLPFEDFTNGYLNKYYSLSMETLYNKEGKKTYCINMEKKNKDDKIVILTGTAYIDADTYEMLSFKGQVEGMVMIVSKDLATQAANVDLSLQINYRHTYGFTEVDNVNYSLSSGNFDHKATIFNIDNFDSNESIKDTLKKKKAKKAKKGNTNGDSDDMLANLDQERFAEIMKTNADFIKRTTEDTELAEATKNSSQSLFTTRYNVAVGDSVKKWSILFPDNSIGNLANRLAKVGQALPQEKIYVHMDNSCYFLGDTIWYSTYLRRTSDDRPSNVSGILYVELINQDGYVQERQMIESIDGKGHGNFVLNPDWYGGFYEIRAYTRWQLNWGVYEREHAEEAKYWFINQEMEQKYFRDYDKLYSRVFPVYDQPKENGKYVKNMSVRVMRQYTRKDPDKRELTVSFYPEGGELIEGVPCRIAFEAKYNDGEYVDGELVQKIDSKTNKTIARTINRGRGVFTYTPSENSKDKLAFIATENRGTLKVKLPEVHANGATIRVERTDSIWNISVQTSGLAADDSLAITIMHDGRVRSFKEIETNGVSTLSLLNDDLEAGVNQATVFNKSGAILADRLFFVTRPELTSENITFSGMKDLYNPYEKITLNVNSKAAKNSNGTISVSVRDKEHADYLFDNASMQTEMLLSSEVKGFIPNPSWFFSADDAEHHNALDLLMLTQGWRRFNWRDMAVRGVWELTQPDERTPVIIGRVYDYPSQLFYNPDEWFTDYMRTIAEGEINPETENIIVPSFSTLKEDSDENFKKYLTIKGILTNQQDNLAVPSTVKAHCELNPVETTIIRKSDIKTDQGRFRITLPKFYGQAFFHLAASDTAKWKRGSDGNRIPYLWIQNMPNEEHLIEGHKLKSRIPWAEFSTRIDFPYPRFMKKYDFYQERLDFNAGKALGEKKLSDGSYQLAEVKVGARYSGIRQFDDSMPAFIVDGYEAYNHALDAGMRDISAENIYRSYVGDYGSLKPYTVDAQSGISTRVAASELQRQLSGNTVNHDSIYLRKNLESHDPVDISNLYSDHPRLEEIEMYAIYTDYQPRLIGSRRYRGANLPLATINSYPFLGMRERRYYRDRRYVLNGIVSPDEFYHTDYSKQALPEVPSDYRRTLYWNPELKLDKNGSATITLWNNSNINQIAVEAEGFTSEGTILSGQK